MRGQGAQRAHDETSGKHITDETPRKSHTKKEKTGNPCFFLLSKKLKEKPATEMGREKK
jgi:hypothetical protein